MKPKRKSIDYMSLIEKFSREKDPHKRIVVLQKSSTYVYLMVSLDSAIG